MKLVPNKIHGSRIFVLLTTMFVAAFASALDAREIRGAPHSCTSGITVLKRGSDEQLLRFDLVNEDMDGCVCTEKRDCTAEDGVLRLQIYTDNGIDLYEEKDAAPWFKEQYKTIRYINARVLLDGAKKFGPPSLATPKHAIGNVYGLEYYAGAPKKQWHFSSNEVYFSPNFTSSPLVSKEFQGVRIECIGGSPLVLCLSRFYIRDNLAVVANMERRMIPYWRSIFNTITKLVLDSNPDWTRNVTGKGEELRLPNFAAAASATAAEPAVRVQFGASQLTNIRHTLLQRSDQNSIGRIQCRI